MACPSWACYGIGIERILSAAVELFYDKDGMVLPPSIAAVFYGGGDAGEFSPTQRSAWRLPSQIYRFGSRPEGLDALIDDRDERPGVKFKDADLIGIPYRVTVGKKLPQGLVEVVERKLPRRRRLSQACAG